MTVVPAEWDARLLAAPNAHLLQSYRWGELQSRYGWEVHRKLIDVGPGDELPLTLLSTATLVPGARYGYIPRGPATDAAGIPAALEAAADVARELNLAYLEFEPELPAGFTPPAGWDSAPPTQPPQTSIVDLRKTPEELLEAFKPKTRYNVRLAAKKGVVAARSDDLAAFAKLSSETSARHGIHLADEAYYRAIHELFGADGSCRLYLAHHDGDCLAGIMILRFGGRATYLFGASANHGRELMPAYAVHWQAMQDALADGDREYDLWGVPPPDQPDHPWAGLTQFKAGWQGTYVAYAGAFALPLQPRVLRAHRGLSRIRSSVRHARNRLGR